eukprot:gb/GEZN01002116.1/.p1 GENE.gb/GEZN01002116.1/~~gb/GEZN01002116.1/.p1  ORF type:complete len:745 (+),score=84.29 gb/GEZN01002116.1/:158-2392(+)
MFLFKWLLPLDSERDNESFDIAESSREPSLEKISAHTEPDQDAKREKSFGHFQDILLVSIRSPQLENFRSVEEKVVGRRILWGTELAVGPVGVDAALILTLGDGSVVEFPMPPLLTEAELKDGCHVTAGRSGFAVENGEWGRGRDERKCLIQWKAISAFESRRRACRFTKRWLKLVLYNGLMPFLYFGLCLFCMPQLGFLGTDKITSLSFRPSTFTILILPVTLLIGMFVALRTLWTTWRPRRRFKWCRWRRKHGSEQLWQTLDKGDMEGLVWYITVIKLIGKMPDYSLNGGRGRSLTQNMFLSNNHQLTMTPTTPSEIWMDEEDPDTDDEKSPGFKSRRYTSPWVDSASEQKQLTDSPNRRRRRSMPAQRRQKPPKYSGMDSAEHRTRERSVTDSSATELSTQRDNKHTVSGEGGKSMEQMFQDTTHLCPLPPLNVSSRQYSDHTNVKAVRWAKGWTQPDPSFFKLRGKNYLTDHQKQQTGPFAFSLMNAELLACLEAPAVLQRHALSHVAARSDSYISRMAKAGRLDTSKLHFVVNFMLPLTPPKAIVAYCKQEEDLKNAPVGDLLDRFVKGSNDFRDETLKFIPRIVEGPWVVTRAVGTTPALIGRKLTVFYYHNEQHNYIEVDVDVGSSIVGGNLLSLVQSYSTSLVLDLSFCLQGNSPEELPERLMGGLRLCNGDLTQCAEVKFENTLLSDQVVADEAFSPEDACVEVKDMRSTAPKTEVNSNNKRKSTRGLLSPIMTK